MGVYTRPDSKFYQIFLEGPGPAPRKFSTRIPIGTTPTARRDNHLKAQQLYVERMDAERKTLEPAPARPEPMTFATLASWYDTTFIAQHKGHERERQILPRLVAAFGPLELTQITRERVMAWRTTRMATPVTIAHCGGKKGKPHTYPAPSARTVNREVGLLKMMLAEAVRSNLLEVSLIAGLRDLKGTTIQRRTMALDVEARLLPVLYPWDRAILLAGLDALVRLGDILDLRRADDLGDHLVIRDPKNGTVCTPPVSTRLRKALNEVPVDELHPEWYFPQRRGGGSERNRTRAFRKALERACTRAKVPYGKKNGGLTFHWGTRRTGASRMIRRGGEKAIGVVQQIGGWKDVGVLVGIYQETITDDMRAAVETVSDAAPPPPSTAPALRTLKKTSLRRVK